MGLLMDSPAEIQVKKSSFVDTKRGGLQGGGMGTLIMQDVSFQGQKWVPGHESGHDMKVRWQIWNSRWQLQNILAVLKSVCPDVEMQYR